MTATRNDDPAADFTPPNNPAQRHPLHVVLFQPEIPPNTGNIGRSCVALDAKLWIIRPFSFRLDSAQIRRSGLDYWQDLEVEIVDSWQDLQSKLKPKNWWLLTKFGQLPYFQAKFCFGDALVVGSESSGLPKSIRQEYSATSLNIPMPGKVRCLNQATSAGIVMYDAARQLGILDGVPPQIEASPVETPPMKAP